MQHPDEGTIHAWVDGQLSPEQASEITTHVAGCAECAAMVAEARGLVAASTRILTALDDVPGGVMPSVPDIAPAQIGRRRWYQRTELRAAAALLFVVGGSLLVSRRGADMESTRAMIATTDKGRPAPAVGSDAAASSPAEAAQQPKADAAASSSAATAPSEAEGKAERPVAARELMRRSEMKSSAPGQADQSLQSKATFEPQSSRLQARDELRSLKQDAAKTQAADMANVSPPVANTPAAPVAQADAPAPPAMAAPAEGRSRSADLGVVGAPASVYATTGSAPLRIVRADSTGSTKRTIYEVSRGVEVTLTESPVETVAERNAAARQKGAAPQNSVAPTAQAEARQRQDALGGRAAGAVMSAPTPVLNSISWTEGGRRFVLTGRLSTKDLEAVKARLGQARR